jgi:hypothetical protein
MEGKQHAEGIKKSIDGIIGSDTFLKAKRKTEDDIQREKFEKIILTLEEIEARAMILGNDLGLDFSSYDEKFYQVIDGLFSMHYNKDAVEVIFFYLYERFNPDGSMNGLVDKDEKRVELNSPSDLWEIVKQIQSQAKKKNARS